MTKIILFQWTHDNQWTGSISEHEFSCSSAWANSDTNRALLINLQTLTVMAFDGTNCYRVQNGGNHHYFLYEVTLPEFKVLFINGLFASSCWFSFPSCQFDLEN